MKKKKETVERRIFFFGKDQMKRHFGLVHDAEISKKQKKRKKKR
jgi:hypothetical protein